MSEPADQLQLARRTDRCSVLGPGIRAVLWVQGCPFRCAGCVAPETLPFEGGYCVPVEALAAELVALPEIEGVTFSGGEPMSQASALCRLIDQIKAQRDLTFLSFTGYTLEELHLRGSQEQLALLERLDLLIDGQYVPSRHTDLRWRGSDNQRVHFLSDRYREIEPALQDRGTWLEFESTPEGVVHWIGIPPRGFRGKFERQMAELGIVLKVGGTVDE